MILANVFEVVPPITQETGMAAGLGALLLYLVTNFAIPYLKKRWGNPSPTPAPAPQPAPVDPSPVDPVPAPDTKTPYLDKALELLKSILKGKLFTIQSDGSVLTEADLVKEVLKKHL